MKKSTSGCLKPIQWIVLGVLASMNCCLFSTGGMLIASTYLSPLPQPSVVAQAVNTATRQPSPTVTSPVYPAFPPTWTATPPAQPTLTGTPVPYALSPWGSILSVTPTSIFHSVTISQTGDADDPWNVFQKYLGYLRDHDVQGANALAAGHARIDMEACRAMLTEEICWAMIDMAFAQGASIQRDQLVNTWQDNKQIIMSSEPVGAKTSNSYSYSRQYLFFIRDAARQIKFLGMNEWAVTTSTEKRAREITLDSDQDAATDSDEECEMSAPPCVKTDPTKRDTDGDGFWDGVENFAQTDPTDKYSHP